MPLDFVRCTPEIETLEIYSASAKLRRMINHPPQTEPASADEVLPYLGSEFIRRMAEYRRAKENN